MPWQITRYSCPSTVKIKLCPVSARGFSPFFSLPSPSPFSFFLHSFPPLSLSLLFSLSSHSLSLIFSLPLLLPPPCLSSSFLFALSGSSWEVHIPYPGEIQVGLLLSPSKWRWWAFQRRAIEMVPFVLHPPPHFFFFFGFLSPPLYPLPPPLLSPAYPLSWTSQFAVAAQVLTHTFSGQPMCLRMTLPGQEQWSNLSFLPELTTAMAVAAALFSSRERGCKENWSKFWASSLHSHSLTCKHSTRRIPGTYRTSQ